jgi:hypothetical protein
VISQQCPSPNGSPIGISFHAIFHPNRRSPLTGGSCLALLNPLQRRPLLARSHTQHLSSQQDHDEVLAAPPSDLGHVAANKVTAPSESGHSTRLLLGKVPPILLRISSSLVRGRKDVPTTPLATPGKGTSRLSYDPGHAASPPRPIPAHVSLLIMVNFRALILGLILELIRKLHHPKQKKPSNVK